MAQGAVWPDETLDFAMMRKAGDMNVMTRSRKVTQLISSTALTLLFCGACGVNVPDPQPEPFPNPDPDPINTNGPDPVDPNPVDPDPVTPDPIDPDPIDTNGVDPVEEPGPADLVGVWRLVEELAFANHVEYDARYIQFAEDGLAMTFGRDEVTSVKECNDIEYRIIGDTGLTFESYEYGREFLVYRFDGFDKVIVTNQRGVDYTLIREDVVPIEYLCQTMEELSRIDTELERNGFGDLEFDGEAFWFNTSPGVDIAMVSTVGVVGQSITGPTGFQFMIAMQGGDIWTHDSNGSDEVIKRYTQAGVEVDSVDSRNELGFEINMQTAAVDPVTGELFLFGKASETGRQSIVRVDTSLQPNRLIEAVEFDIYLNSLSHDGQYLWGLDDFRLIKIDPTTYEAVETFNLRPIGFDSVRVATLDERIFVMMDSHGLGTVSIAEMKPSGAIAPLGLDHESSSAR